MYFRENEIYVLASAKNVFGIYKSGEPFFKLMQPVRAEALGEKVLEAIAAFRQNVPGEYYVRGAKMPLHPFLKFSGFRSWRSFEKSARYFLVTMDDNKVTILPSIPYPKGGYAHQPDRSMDCASRPAEIGHTLLQAIQSDGFPENLSR
ncbi:MAG TPA: hypothetical protein VFQ00_12070 [Terriglobales bacterium]|nr:hypothetical protein [Terriglobales bacterium]